MESLLQNRDVMTMSITHFHFDDANITIHVCALLSAPLNTAKLTFWNLGLVQYPCSHFAQRRNSAAISTRVYFRMHPE